jgi:creatinine amidohydrolase
VPGAVLLENLTWVEAKEVLSPEVIVVIPLGASAKEHGPHLKLNNDSLIAEYLKTQILTSTESENIVVAPTINTFYYPAFVEYPGSISILLGTARDTIVEICQSLARHGPTRFYVINTGLSTIKALQPAAEILADQGILLQYTDFEKTIATTVRDISEQEGGSHADEIETSLMLVIAPDTVDMTKAVKDFDKTGRGRLSRTREVGKTYSPTGIWGDASLATVEKGQAVVKSLVDGIFNDIKQLRKAPLPKPEL